MITVQKPLGSAELPIDEERAPREPTNKTISKGGQSERTRFDILSLTSEDSSSSSKDPGQLTRIREVPGEN